MLRAAAAALVVANLLFFCWAHGLFVPGWPPPRHGEREPERTAAQIRPDAVTLLPPKAASAALTAARAAAALCLEAGPFAEAEIAAAESTLAALQLPAGRLLRDPLAPPQVWLVYAGHYADAATRRVREEALRKLGLAVEVLPAASAPAELAPGLLLSSHPSREAAEAAFAAVTATVAATAGARLRGVRVLQLPPAPLSQWLRVAQAEPELADRIKALPPAGLAGGFKPCATRP